MLVYVSEIDELKNENKKIEKELKNINKEVKNIRATIVNYANLKDNCIKLLKEQIKTIQFAYEQSYNINNEILQLAHIMVDNYVPSCQNYYVMTNLINNTSFKFAKCEELDKKYSLNQNNINTLIIF